MAFNIFKCTTKAANTRQKIFKRLKRDKVIFCFYSYQKNTLVMPSRGDEREKIRLEHSPFFNPSDISKKRKIYLLL